MAINEKKLIEFIDPGHLRKPNEKCFSENDIVEMINKQPKVGEWIPCSERLPEEDGRYVCQTLDGDYDYIEILSFAKNLSKICKYDFYGKKYAGFYEYDSEWGYFEVDNVIAWQPLPEAYKGE